MANAATSFDVMIKADREKRKREQLAQSMLGSRKGSSGAGSLPTKRAAAALAPSLASRVGVTKRPSLGTSKPSIDGQWTHDLHDVGMRRNSRPSSTTGERGNRIHAGLQRELANTNNGTRQANIQKIPTGPSMSIRGMAATTQTGPFVVIASNFAPGTTAADIEAAMLPIGGEIRSCRLASAAPTVIAELIFEDKGGAENVIATFNNQKADGRLLYVYLKSGGPTPGLHPLHNSTSSPASAPVQEIPASAPAPVPEPAFKVDLVGEDVRGDRDLMEVDDDRGPRRDDRRPRYDDRDNYRGDRSRGDYRGNGRYDYGRPTGPRGYGGGGHARLYSDIAQRSDRRYGR